MASYMNILMVVLQFLCKELRTKIILDFIKMLKTFIISNYMDQV